jgi:hypothetical protein
MRLSRAAAWRSAATEQTILSKTQFNTRRWALLEPLSKGCAYKTFAIVFRLCASFVGAIDYKIHFGGDDRIK